MNVYQLQKHSLKIAKALLMAALFAVSLTAEAESSHLAGPGSSLKNLTSEDKPKDFDGMGITENLGQTLDLGMTFKDEQGQVVTLAKFYDGTHPVVISPIYFSCPGLCNFHLNGVIDTLKEMDWSVGNQFKYIVVSFDSKETPELAAGKKANYMKSYGRPGTEKGWHFLTADEATVQKLTAALGFQFRWDEASKQWAHASAAIVTTPQGKISRYLHGIMFDSKNFKLALGEASEGRVGSLMEKMIFYCFKYDPHQSKYTLYAFRLVQLGGALIILVLAGLLLPAWIRARREIARRTVQ